MRKSLTVRLMGDLDALEVAQTKLIQAFGGRVISSPKLRNKFEEGYRCYMTVEVIVEPFREGEVEIQ